MNIVSKKQVDALMSKITECRNKWGTNTWENFSPESGKTLTNAVDMNKLRNWVDDVNRRSGANKGLPQEVKKGEIIKDILSNLTMAAEQIRVHCSCNCNYCKCNCNNCTCHDKGCGDGNNS